MALTDTQVKAAKAMVEAVYSAIKEFGARGVPSGHLYAALMGCMSLNTYSQIIGMLKSANLITESGHVLRAVEA